MFRHESHYFSFFILFGCVFIVSYAQTSCDGTIAGGNVAGIIVPGTSCILDGVTVTGSVSVTNGGTLTTLGSTAILGNINADGSGNVELGGTTSVSGASMFNNSPGSVTVEGNAVITDLSLSNSGSAAVRGTASSVSISGSGALTVDGGEIGGGGLMIAQSVGDIVLCGANVNGSVSMVESEGNLLAEVSGICDATVIGGSILIEKGNGDVSLTDVEVGSGDLIVVELTGALAAKGGIFSDISISKVSGHITLTDLSTDSDVGLLENAGDVAISNGSFTGDVSVTRNEGVVVSGSKFGFESVSLKLNQGPVVVTGNSELSLSVEENNNVTIRDNSVEVASILSNSGGVTIVDNSFNELSCVDNQPGPTGMGNVVILPVSGQCTSVVV